jgi:KDO2-lipid IV(A) lauroyltransferase
VIFEIREKEYKSLPVRFLRSDLSLKDALMALKRNELVAIAFDGRIGENWVQIEFCGNEINIAPGPVKFAMKTGATILPTFIVTNPDNTHKLIFEKAMVLEKLDGKEMSVKMNLQKISDIFEKYIVNYPSHFGMILTIIRKRIEKGILKTPFFVEPHRIPEDVSVSKV